MVKNHPLYSNVKISHDVDIPVDDIPVEIWDMIALHEDINGEDQKEHANYTPQTDVVCTPSVTQADFPVSCHSQEDTIVMDSTGLIDLEGSSVHTTTQMQSAIQSLQGTVFVPAPFLSLITTIHCCGLELIPGYFVMELVVLRSKERLL